MVVASDDQKSDIDRLLGSAGNPYCPICCDPECPVTSEYLDPDSECTNGETNSLASAKELFFSNDSHPLIDEIKRRKEHLTDPPPDDYGSSTALHTDQDDHWDMSPGIDHSWNEDDPSTWWDYQTDEYYNYD